MLQEMLNLPIAAEVPVSKVSNPQILWSRALWSRPIQGLMPAGVG